MIYISLTKCIVSLLFMSWAWAFPLVSPKEHQISASDGLTAASKPTIIPLIEAYETPTSTVAVTSTPTVTPLFLPVTSSPPDDLGISQVSGFYGPGAWSAWFLTIVASWWRIFRRSEEKFDPNTWFFLLGTNWAALDIFRGIHSLRAISSSVDPAEYMAEYKSKMGLLGAAFNVVFWGTFHIVWQFLPTMYIFQDNDAHKPRLRTLTAGLIFPLLALAASIPLSDIHDLPALYWNGMDSDTHDLVFGMAAGTLVLTIPAIAMGWGLILPGRLVTAIHRLMTSSVTRLIVLLNCLVTISFAPSIATGNAYYWIVVSSLVCYVTPVRWVLPLFWIGVILGATIVYVVKGYLLRSTRAGESCFLMPCAPQSIREADQMYALFAGLFVFIGCEVMPPVVTKLKEWYKERERFVRQTRLRLEQFEMRRRVANVVGTLSNTQSSPTPGRDVP